jgi:hypothetical protein
LLESPFRKNNLEGDDSVKKKEYIGISKGGHSQFNPAPPQLCNIADKQINCGVAD